MPKSKKLRYTSDKSDDSDYQFESNEEDDKSSQPIVATSSGRLVRPSLSNTSKTGKNDETNNKEDNDISVQVPMQRIKNHDIERTCAPDFSKIVRYLTSVKQTRDNSINLLNEEELKAMKSGRQTLSQFWQSRINTICPTSKNIKPSEFSCWKRIDDLSPSLTRWIGTHSIGLIIQGSVPNGIQSLLDDEIEKIASTERQPLPFKLPRKRGRPRKDDLSRTNRLLATPLAEPTEKNSLTVNEHLQSLVSKQIEATTSIINQMKKGKGRSTNNSMASALIDSSTSLPSTSFSSTIQRTHQTRLKNNISSLNQKSQQKSKSTKNSPQKAVKMEVEDFSLPAEFSHGINFSTEPPLLSSLSTNNERIKNDKTKATSNRSHSSKDIPKTTTLDEASSSVLPSTSNKQNQTQKFQNGDNLHSKSPLSKPSLRKETGKTQPKYNSNGGVDLPVLNEKQINIPIFSGQTLPFEFDVSPAVQRYESVQVVDIVNNLLSEPSTTTETTTYNSLIPDQNGLDSAYQNRIEHQKLKKIKSNRRFAQTLFCGGPIADIAVCPHALPDGNELFVVATFADEKYLDCRPTEDEHSYLQIWTTTTKFTDNFDTQTNIPSDLDALINTNSSSTSAENNTPLVLESIPLLTLCHSPLRNIKTEEGNIRRNNSISSLKEGLDSIPLLKVQWSPFDGSRHIAAISASWFVYIWSIFGDSNEVTLPLWTLPIDGLLSSPMSIGWLEQDKICVSYRNRQFNVHQLQSPSAEMSTYSTRLILECESAKGSGIFCNTRPLLFSGAITFDSYAFNYLGTQQQALCYLALQQKMSGKDDGFIESVMASNLSNCHQIRLTSACICPNSGICSSVGADGRMCCSLNGRLAPKNVIDVDNFMHGRALLQLISHRKNPINYEDDNNTENKSIFCYSHVDCLTEKSLEVRLGDCAILEQKNERVNGRSFPETCVDRRLESLTVVDCSYNTVGLTFCGGDSGLVFIVPCTL
uniref:WD_REPEATS_REGION domain-containing protein n=1 Tax=Meloidogyne hapla TaxID=6305 RepID=A0A1I8BY64_MELHA